MATSTVDYQNTFFKHANLTKIHGEPTFESIRILQREIIVNALSVHSDLGGGAHGHIGLVLSPQEYALHSDAAYECPQHPRQLVIYVLYKSNICHYKPYSFTLPLDN